jgi:hypothetical protein
MSTLFDRLQPTLETEVFAPLTGEPEITFVQNHEAWDPILFGEQQIQSLVSQIFLARRPKPARQVVFTAVDAETDIATICRLGKSFPSKFQGVCAWCNRVPPCTRTVRSASRGARRLSEKTSSDRCETHHDECPTTCGWFPATFSRKEVDRAFRRSHCPAEWRSCVSISTMRSCAGRRLANAVRPPC